MIHFPKGIKTSLIQRAELHALFIKKVETTFSGEVLTSNNFLDVTRDCSRSKDTIT